MRKAFSTFQKKKIYFLHGHDSNALSFARVLQRCGYVHNKIKIVYDAMTSIGVWCWWRCWTMKMRTVLNWELRCSQSINFLLSRQFYYTLRLLYNSFLPLSSFSLTLFCFVVDCSHVPFAKYFYYIWGGGKGRRSHSIYKTIRETTVFFFSFYFYLRRYRRCRLNIFNGLLWWLRRRTNTKRKHFHFAVPLFDGRRIGRLPLPHSVPHTAHTHIKW